MLRRTQSFSSVNKIEYDNEAENNDDETNNEYSILTWYPGKNRKPMVNFAASFLLLGTPENCLDMIKRYHLSYKFVKTECKLVRNMFACHGFRESHPNSIQFNVMWTGTHLKPYTLRALTECQKVNHFPRSYELTRKDRLYKNIQRMQHSKGVRHFDFIPQSFILPSELNDFYGVFLKDRGPWIVKPCASSRGRGIYLINHTNQIPLDENVLICKYISNPLLINGFKYDCRIYVAVTSYEPLRIYIYEEGLARFSTVKYDNSSTNIHNQWMHLTNYSVNKNNDEYIRSEDPEVDDYGSKWSFSAMLRCLRDAGKDAQALMARIEDVIIKTIISGEMAIATACKMFVPHRGNCFELFGFDILIDENLKPWLLEVNLSPSLACDSPLDLKIKSNLISDLFNLTGIVADDPTLKKPPKLLAEAKKKQRLSWGSYNTVDLKALAEKSANKINDGLSNEERKVLRDTRDEYKRKGNFIRVYPSPESWELYGSLQEHQTTYNKIIHSKLFPELWRSSQRPCSATYIARARNFSSIKSVALSTEDGLKIKGENFHSRYVQYERKLISWSSLQDTEETNKKGSCVQTMARPSLVQGQLSSDHVLPYENALLRTERRKYEPVDVKEALQLGAYLNKIQAREAFAVYLQRVQHRLLQEISTEKDGTKNMMEKNMMEKSKVQKQEQQIDLIHRFLVKAAINLSNPINIDVPSKSLPLLDRKKILARELNDFVRVYSRETQLLSDKDDNLNVENLDQHALRRFSLSDEKFSMFLPICSENELEEILTMYTRYNKSASIFLGAKPSQQSSKKPCKEQLADNFISHQRSTQETRDVSSNKSSNPTKSRKRQPSDQRPEDEFMTRPSSTNSSQPTNDNRVHQRHLSADSRHPLRTATQTNRNRSSGYKQHLRQLSSDSLIRSSSRGSHRPDSNEQKLRTLSTVCAYTGANDMLKLYKKELREKSAANSRISSRPRSSTNPINPIKHVYGVDDSTLKEALRHLSLKQSERTYSSNNLNQNRVSYEVNQVNDDIDSNNTSSDDEYGLVNYSQPFVLDNNEKFPMNNVLQQSAQARDTSLTRESKDSWLLRRCVNNNQKTIYCEPRPPEGRRPLIKQQISSQRMARLVRKK